MMCILVYGIEMTQLHIALIGVVKDSSREIGSFSQNKHLSYPAGMSLELGNMREIGAALHLKDTFLRVGQYSRKGAIALIISVSLILCSVLEVSPYL